MEEQEISLGSAKIDSIMIALEKLKELQLDEVTFEFIINSFFQEVPINMINNLQKEYDRGYKEGYYDAKELFYKLP